MLVRSVSAAASCSCSSASFCPATSSARAAIKWACPACHASARAAEKLTRRSSSSASRAAAAMACCSSTASMEATCCCSCCTSAAVLPSAQAAVASGPASTVTACSPTAVPDPVAAPPALPSIHARRLLISACATWKASYHCRSRLVMSSMCAAAAARPCPASQAAACAADSCTRNSASSASRAPIASTCCCNTVSIRLLCSANASSASVPPVCIPRSNVVLLLAITFRYSTTPVSVHGSPITPEGPAVHPKCPPNGVVTRMQFSLALMRSKGMA
mmetsp:Transcript_31256/g.55999  ORF Transcript_31256/g.55999 Transcript_31256/m.55999 type:complete len:275 (+) Transcript_31256:145-969(+)